jgi:hypothetical protein
MRSSFVFGALCCVAGSACGPTVGQAAPVHTAAASEDLAATREDIDRCKAAKDGDDLGKGFCDRAKTHLDVIEQSIKDTQCK